QRAQPPGSTGLARRGAAGARRPRPPGAIPATDAAIDATDGPARPNGQHADGAALPPGAFSAIWLAHAAAGDAAVSRIRHAKRVYRPGYGKIPPAGQRRVQGAAQFSRGDSRVSQARRPAADERADRALFQKSLRVILH